jgi:hypothetical protein
MITNSTTFITASVVAPSNSTSRPEWILSESIDLIPASLHIGPDTIDRPSLGTGLSVFIFGLCVTLASAVAACGF